MTVQNIHAADHARGSASPWSTIIEYLPYPYVITDRGVFIEPKKKADDIQREYVSGPCWVTALTRSATGQEWGLVVHWMDQDGIERDMAIPASRLSEPRAPIAGELASLGLKVVPGSERKLMTYLGSFDLPPSFRVRSASQVGWIDGDDGSPMFILPDRTLSLNDTDKVVFQPEQHSPTVGSMKQNGSLKQWQAFVAQPCKGNPLLIFSVCAAFAGSLLKFASLDSGGFHFYGLSSKGKTTALQVAASVFGCGADPAVSDDSYISRWNTTGNALEATAAAHNDSLLTLDEMGTCDAKDFGKVVYDLFGGKGKARLNKSSLLQAQRTWRILGISTGEISVREKIEEGTRTRAKAGHTVRLADIPIETGVIVDSHGKAPADFANELKRSCGHYYGVAGPRFLHKLINLKPETILLRQSIQADIEASERNLVKDRELESHQHRVLRRFAAVTTAGILAIRFGILPFTQDEVIQAVLTVRDAWLGDEGNESDSMKGFKAVREFILRNPGRFRPVNFSDDQIKDLAGYYAEDIKLYLFTGQGFNEACSGFQKDMVLDELDKRGFLFKNEYDRKKSKHTIHGIGRISLYAIKGTLLEAE